MSRKLCQVTVCGCSTFSRPAYTTRNQCRSPFQWGLHMQGVCDRLRCVRVKGKGAAKRSWINCVSDKWRGKGRRPGQCKLTRTFGGLGCDVFARQPDQCLVLLRLTTLHHKGHARVCMCSPYKRRQTCVRISIKRHADQKTYLHSR